MFSINYSILAQQVFSYIQFKYLIKVEIIIELSIKRKGMIVLKENL